MNIADLITELEHIADDHPDAEVKLATQPSWPLRSNLSGVVHEEDACAYDSEPDEPEQDEGESADIVWLVEGGQDHENPYAPSAVFEAV